MVKGQYQNVIYNYPLGRAMAYRPAGNTEQTTLKWVNALAVISDPRLDADKDAVWYLLSVPNVAPVIRLAQLNGQNAPVVEEKSDFDQGVIKYKIRFDVAAAAVGWAGAVRMQ